MHLTIHTDGGARGNPGPAAIGFTIHHGQNLLFKHGECIGNATNNVAEYAAVIHALTWIKNNLPKADSLEFFLDSSLVINQLQGNFKIKQPHLIPLHLQIRNLLQTLPYRASFHHIPRSLNSLADSLVNLALDSLPSPVLY